MNRRNFLKILGLLGGSILFSSKFNAYALSSEKDISLILKDNINYKLPKILPKIINIYLYGGASELAGNLTNIQEINRYSQNPYPSELLKYPDEDNSEVTKNFLWKSAGGDIMERLLASGDMSIYRTVHRIKSDTKSHELSIKQNLVGNLDINRPGIATTLAALLSVYNPFNKEIRELKLPFVTFEGNSAVFNKGSVDVSNLIQPIALTPDFSNPYARKRNKYLRRSLDSKIDRLAILINERINAKFSDINYDFKSRKKVDEYISSIFNKNVVEANLPIDPETGSKIQYPDTITGKMLEAAVSLAILNPDTIFISLGSAGTGLWDDHSDGIIDYPVRMRQLMSAIEVAVKHMKLVGRNDIIINVFGDFGRNVNLNNARGWDHGNNQNLYTFGGSNISGRELGKIVGKTKREGNPYKNRQFTVPTDDSYQFEPFAIASTIYKYFGVLNPEDITGELPIDENAPNELLV